MARFFAFLLFLLTIALVLGARWYYICEMKGFCGEEEEILPTPVARLGGLDVYDGDSLILADYNQFAFPEGLIAPDLNDNNQALIEKLSAYLSANTDRHLQLEAGYRPTEAGVTVGRFENLGLARADALREMLVARGLDIKRTAIGYFAAASDALSEPLRIGLYVPSEEDEFEREVFTFTNMTFSDANFAFDSDVFEPGVAFMAYADSLAIYLGAEEEKTVTIVGHTDNIDNDRYNLDLGLRRAESAAAFLRDSIGVSNDIITQTQGERRPVAPNNTAEGRQKNRRVNFIIQ
ncbi:MAG: OmpA family protein [Bacteroidota bacterium]